MTTNRYTGSNPPSSQCCDGTCGSPCFLCSNKCNSKCDTSCNVHYFDCDSNCDTCPSCAAVYGSSYEGTITEYAADGIGLFDAETETFSWVDISTTLSGTNKFRGATVAPNGLIVLAPDGAPLPPSPALSCAVS